MTLPRTADLPIHDPTGPSTLGRLLGCPGSLRLSLSEPEIRSEWAEEGLRQHRALETAIRTGKLPDDLSAEDRTRVEKCLEFFEEKSAGRVVAQWIESHVELVDGDTFVNYGTADLVALLEDPRELLVIDWKFGRKVYQHALVLQLANYAGAAASSIPELWGKPLPATAYAFFPLYNESFVWRSADIHAGLGVVAAKVKGVIAQAHQADAPVRPGPWCDTCNHLPNCEAVRAQAGLVAEHFQSRLPADPKKVLELYDAASLAQKQADAVKQRIREILEEEPGAIPGLEYQEVNGARYVEDSTKFWEALVGAGHVDSGRFSDECTQEVISISKSEALYIESNYRGRSSGGPTKAELKKKFAAITEAAVKQPKQKRLRRVSSE